jgi:hypothetical protein
LNETMNKDSVYSVKGPSGQARVVVPFDSDLDALKVAIKKTTGIPARQQKLAFGYPPKSLSAGEALPKGGSVTVSVLPDSRVVRRVVPANNSCLFSAFAYCLLNRSRNIVSVKLFQRKTCLIDKKRILLVK